MVSNRFVLEQGPVVWGLIRTVASALAPQGGKTAVRTPTPYIVQELPPRKPALVKAYVSHVGGDPAAYRETLPPHFFPQWAFPVAGQTLQGLPYPLLKVVNGGCRLEINHPLPANEPLRVRARLEEVVEKGSRVVLHQKIITDTPTAKDALVAHLYALVPSGKKRSSKEGGGGASRQPAVVPPGAREIARWNLPANAGLDFARLTGDFNPIHWVAPYARAAGFKSTILHGFGTLARAVEGLNRSVCAGAKRLKTVDVKFTKPLVLPATVGLYLGPDDEFYVGDTQGGVPYMTGTFSVCGQENDTNQNQGVES